MAMYVDRIMTRDVVTVTEQAKLARLSELMQLRKLRHLPVVDDAGRLVGIISHRDVQRAEPSPITTLDVGEVNYLLSKVTAGQIMHRSVVTARPEMLVEQAGCLMRDRRVGCLPVVDDDKLVGIITGVDLVDFFLEVTGCQVTDAARIAVHLADDPGRLAGLLTAINQAGGKIVTVVSPTHIDDSGQRTAIVRFRADDPQAVIDALRAAAYDLDTVNLPE
jgi:acetoin utilization protein AcuB